MTTLQNVLDFLTTATITERNLISVALSTAGSASITSRAVKAAATLSQITENEPVTFLYDGVNYTGIVKKINRTTARVQITKIDGNPRNRITVGAEIRVGASILARTM